LLYAIEGDTLKVGDSGLQFSANLNIDLSGTGSEESYYSSDAATVRSVTWNGTHWKSTASNFV